MFDLPQPFGPTMPMMSWSKWMTVRSTNDLNPVISSFLMCIQAVLDDSKVGLWYPTDEIAGRRSDRVGRRGNVRHYMYRHVASFGSTPLNGCAQVPTSSFRQFAQHPYRLGSGRLFSPIGWGWAVR